MDKKPFKGLGFLLNNKSETEEIVCQSGLLYVKKSSVFGLGVFSKIDLAEGATIEVVPIIEFDGKTNRIFDHVPVISNIRCSYPTGYDFPHANKEVKNGGFIPLGYGCVYKGEQGGVVGNALMQFKITENGDACGAAVITAAAAIPKNTEIVIKQNWDSRMANTDLSNTMTILDKFREQEDAITKSLLPIIMGSQNIVKDIHDNCLTKLAEESKRIIEHKAGEEISLIELGEALAFLVDKLNELNELFNIK